MYSIMSNLQTYFNLQLISKTWTNMKEASDYSKHQPLQGQLVAKSGTLL